MRFARGFLPILIAVVIVAWPSLVVGAAHPSAASVAPTGLLRVDFNVQVDAGSADYVQRAANIAIENHYDMLIVMNTPGGLLDSMTKIVSAVGSVEGAGLRVITFVPPNSNAASAGSYIALASDAVYMGAGAVIGPSTPIIVGGTPDEVAHLMGYVEGLMQSLAEGHNYNVAAALDMVENNTAYTTQRAVAVGLVTGQKDTVDDVLSTEGLTALTLYTYGEPIYDQFLSFLSDPLIDGLFILVGVVALVLDIFHQTIFLTVLAVIMIALGFVGAGLIGAPIAAILMLIIAAALIFIEVKAGHGLFAGTGILVGIAGTYLLVYGVGWSPSPFGWGQYAVLGVAAGAMVVAFIYLAKIRRSLMAQPKLVDPKLIVGKTGRTMTDVLPGKDGVANVDAEDWTATSEEPIEKGALVRVKSYADGRVILERLPSPGQGGAEKSA